jgi:hypothetical protein
MAAITWTDVTDVAPAMSTGVPVGFQTKILAYVEEVVNPAAFGGEDSITYLLARSYLAAHYAALYKEGTFGTVGPVTSMSEGGVSQSFASTMPQAESSIGRTNYGDAFLTFVRRSGYARAGFTT